MKILIKESQLDSAIDRLLKSQNVKYDVNYKQNAWDNNGNQFVEGTVWLYKDGQIFGYRFGYDFFFKVGFRKKLEYEGRYPHIENVDFFKAFPPEIIIDFFAQKVKKYLEKGIEDKWITVR